MGRRAAAVAIAAIVFVAAILLWCAWPFVFARWATYLGVDQHALGERFDSLSALFSGLAFAGVIIAILLQREELQLQRKELELTRQELAGQKKVMDAQHKTMQHQSHTSAKQGRDSRIFELLRLHNALVDDVSAGGEFGPPLTGESALRTFAGHLLESLPKESGATIHSELKEWFRRADRVGPVMRNLNVVLELAALPEGEPTLYCRVIASQLSQPSLGLLFYWLLAMEAREAKRIVERHGLFRFLQDSSLRYPADRDYYLSTAFEAEPEPAEQSDKNETS